MTDTQFTTRDCGCVFSKMTHHEDGMSSFEIQPCPKHRAEKPLVEVNVSRPVDLGLLEVTPDNTGEPELDPPNLDEMQAQVKTFQTEELVQALSDLRQTQNRLRQAVRTIVKELNRRSAIR